MNFPFLTVLHDCNRARARMVACVRACGSGVPRQRRMQHSAAHRLTVITEVWKLVFHKRGLPASPPPMTGAERTCGGGSPTGCPLHRYPGLPRPTAPSLVPLPTGERPKVSCGAGGSCCVLPLSWRRPGGVLLGAQRQVFVFSFSSLEVK